MKIYAVEKTFDNGELYEDWEQRTNIFAMCMTREIAERFVANITLSDKWIEGDPYPNNPTICERIFHCRKSNPNRPRKSIVEQIYYTIKEYEVIEK